MKDLQEIQHLDFTPRLTCDRRESEASGACGQSGTWVVRCTGCEAVSVVCGTCRLFLEVLPNVRHRCGADGDPQDVLAFQRLVAG